MPSPPLLPPVGTVAAADALDRLYDHVVKVILSRQHPVTGLLPASTAVTVHGNYTHAWVRDNVYSVIGPWALAVAFRRRGDRPSRARLLEQAVLKTMRGLLQAMMRQADKVERFKHSQAPLDSLHAIYSAATGTPVTGDDGWGHLQVDATALYLLTLAQMTRAGLPILLTMDEVAFVQNLVHYIGPAYRIADFGIWERGRKINDGQAELNASSIGMAKAALEAIQGVDMFGDDVFGPDEPRLAVIHAVPDEIARARATLEALLPRESGSKEVDAACLSIIGWPAFAVEDPDLVRRTAREIAEKLEGPWGCKRFLRDGHQTVLEDHSRLHYEAGELERFDGIESEWPLFFTYQYVTACMRGERDTAAGLRAKLDSLLEERNGEPALPELFLVAADRAEAERANPGSQPRQPNENVPLLWAQSLFVLGLLLEHGLLSPADIDPLDRRSRIGRRPPVPLRLVLLAEDDSVRASLAAAGASAQILHPDGPVRVCEGAALNQVMAEIGRCPALGLSGRPARRLGSLVTAQAFRLAGKATVFVPTFIDEDDFYFSFDNRVVAERLRAEIAYVNHAWGWPEHPLLVLPVSRAMVQAAGFTDLARTLADLSQGRVPDLAVAGATLGEALADARMVALAAIPAPAPLMRRPLVTGSAEELRYRTAGRQGDWATVRHAAFTLDRHDERLQDAIKEMVVRQKRVVLGRPADPLAVVEKPLDNAGVIDRLKRVAGDDPGREMLAEEALLFLGTAIKATPALFAHCPSLRPLELVGLAIRALQRETGLAEAEAAARLAAESPHAVQGRWRALVAGCPGMTGDFCLPGLSGLDDSGPLFGLETEDAPWAVAGDWWAWRDVSGTLLPVPEDFFVRVWEVLRHCDALVIADPADPAHRLDTALRADRTPAERDFAREVEARLDRIPTPEYRQMTVEALWAAAALFRFRPGLRLQGVLSIDALLADAVRRNPAAAGLEGAALWQAAFTLSPATLAELVCAGLLARCDIMMPSAA